MLLVITIDKYSESDDIQRLDYQKSHFIQSFDS